MCRLVRIAAMMAITRLRPSSTRKLYHIRLMFSLTGMACGALLQLVSFNAP
jgi:hypothetical protein